MLLAKCLTRELFEITFFFYLGGIGLAPVAKWLWPSGEAQPYKVVIAGSIPVSYRGLYSFIG